MTWSARAGRASEGDGRLVNTDWLTGSRISVGRDTDVYQVVWWLRHVGRICQASAYKNSAPCHHSRLLKKPSDYTVVCATK